MPYAGKVIQPRDFAEYIAPVWTNPEERMKAMATALAESRITVGAWHDNMIDDKLKSRDCGIYQINISAENADTDYQDRLMTASKDPEVYIPVVKYNVQRARSLYDTPWLRNGKLDKRRWQPWVAYNQGWSMFTEWWIWSQTSLYWRPTGRYIHKAIQGWANWHLMVRKDMSQELALQVAEKHQARYGIEGKLGVRTNKKGISYVAWLKFPKKPTNPPEDGIGPRPVPNQGL